MVLGRPKGRYLDAHREEIRASLAKTQQISVSAIELKVKEQTLRNYLRAYPELFPKDFGLQPRGALADIPHERITELLRQYTVGATAELLGVTKNILGSLLRRRPALVPPEARDPEYKKLLIKKERLRYIPKLEGKPVSAKNVVSAGTDILAAFKTVLLLESRLKKKWGLLPGEYFFLLFLSENEMPLESGVLADTLGVTRSAASRYLSGLDRKGLVRFAVGKPDMRTMVYSLNKEGSELVKKISGDLFREPL